MIERLRRKFIALSIFAVFIVVSIIIGSINYMNYQRVEKRADTILEILWENNGFFPSILENMSPETRYRTRFFSVWINDTGELLKIDTINIASKNEKDVAEYALKVLNKNQKNGFIDGYRFKNSLNSEGRLIVFLDCSQELDIFRSFLKASILISSIGLGFIFLIIFLYSKKIVEPVIESHLKQKQFITDVSHELKTPLSIINLNTDVIEMNSGESEWTRSIHKQINRLSELIKNMIILSRMDESDQEIEMKNIDISNISHEIIDSYRALIKENNLDLILDIESELLFLGNEESIKQLISIALDNAIKYSIKNGKIEYKVKSIDKKIYIEVKNETENLKVEKLDYVFDRFYRMDQSRSSEIEGHGIGLSIAKAIVQRYKGRIYANAEENKYFVLKIIL
ncbi:MAG: HAMP domain-containing sensor histidine kinase [Andreesenia angusta]|nr:HAMP domain-containing sensor histidine kinase [Andreesenia angusta]